jgi:GH15 family glucan-1,4-alpha-glucosidase
MAYQPIENYGVIGDMHTIALVGIDGSIDWLCVPHFDSPSVFAAILDDEKGGSFRIAPDVERKVSRKQLYWPDTNVLVTRFLCPDGVAELIDYMPVGRRTEEGTHRIVRQVSMVRGTLSFKIACNPAFDYARADHETRITEHGALFVSRNLRLSLCSPVPLQHVYGGAGARFVLHENETATFVFHTVSEGEGPVTAPNPSQSQELFRRTVGFWRRWIGKSTYTGRWREMVNRSALVLKLLTFEPTGAIVAAPTTSLPESLGGERNWDYRYTWIRDAAFTLYGLLRIGFTEEAERFMEWIEARAREPNPDGSLQIMYGIDGRHDLSETRLDHLSGYRGSAPVRIGNDAYSQLQLDIYGELLDSVYLYNKYGAPISYDFWVALRALIDWVTSNWNQEDEGIWEVRGGRRHFTYSKLMCWVALDRGLRLADKRSFPVDRGQWLAQRDRIYEEIMTRGYSRERNAFVQAYDGKTLDAANLVMPLVFFVSPTDRRMLATLEATLKPPNRGGLVSNSLTYRYNGTESSDGLRGEEGTFNICSFWLVEAMTRAGRTMPAYLEDARLMFEKMLGYANHLGLFAEETGPSGEALGNFPQAFTHLALISAAHNLDRTLG